MKVLMPNLRVVLIEANRRRVNFLKHLGREFHFEGFEVLGGRAEALQSSLPERFDVVTLRAVSRPEAAVTLGGPFLRPEGTLLVSLGPTAVSPRVPDSWTQEIVSVPLPFSSIHRRILRIRRPGGARKLLTVGDVSRENATG